MDVPSSQPKPWRDLAGFVDDEAIDVDEDGQSGGSDVGDMPEEPSHQAWRDGHNRAWNVARRVGLKTPHAAKRPRSQPQSPVSEEQDPELDEKVPQTSTDLARYFGKMPYERQIAICRAYASYLAAQRRGSTSEK